VNVAEHQMSNYFSYSMTSYISRRWWLWWWWW